MEKTFKYGSVTYTMTEEQIEAAFRFRNREYEVEDAKGHVTEMLGNEDSDYIIEHFGISFEEASSDAMCNAYAERFEDIHDCNCDENSLWEAAIEDVLYEMKAARGA